jgi:UDP-glucuronate decarboxylase
LKILVTGAAGFLGSHLSESLITKGYEVVAVDNLFTGNMQNIQHLQEYANFSFLEHDICEPINLIADGIINLACPASPHHYQLSPVYTMKTSIIGAINLLELSKQTSARILQASTSEIYGDPLVSPQAENYWGNVNPIGLRSCYDEGKRAAETLFTDYRREYGLDTRIVRIFNTYGPRMQENDGRVVSNFIVQALKNENITIYGDGQQVRSFCYVDDLVEGIVSVFLSEDNFGPINLGNPEPITISELAREIIEITGSKSKVIFMPLRSDDPQVREPDITLATEKFSWVPKISREEGLRKTISYFDGRLNAAG